MTMTSIQILSLDIMDEESTGLSTRVIGYRKPQEMQEGIGEKYGNMLFTALHRKSIPGAL